MLMILDLSSLGEKYISAGEAAKKLGYASDYIGQLCRTQRVPGKLIGRTWFVDLEALTLHKKNHNMLKGRRPRRSAGPGQEFIAYEKDSRPLLPTLSKRERAQQSSWERKLLAASASAALVALLLGTGSLSLGERAYLKGISTLSGLGSDSTAIILSGFEDLRKAALDLTIRD